MTPGRIDCVRLDRNVEFRQLPDVYQYRPGNGWAWLQRLAIRVLQWRKCYASSEFVTYERHVIGERGEIFMQRLFEQQNNLLDLGKHPKELLIGAEDYGRLMSEPPSVSGFDFRGEYYKGDAQGGRKVCGLTVRVIPWMRGMLVMP